MPLCACQEVWEWSRTQTLYTAAISLSGCVQGVCLRVARVGGRCAVVWLANQWHCVVWTLCVLHMVLKVAPSSSRHVAMSPCPAKGTAGHWTTVQTTSAWCQPSLRVALTCPLDPGPLRGGCHCVVFVTVTALGDLWSHQLTLSPMPVCPFYDKVYSSCSGWLFWCGSPLALYVFCCDLETRSPVLLTSRSLGKDRECACVTENALQSVNRSVVVTFVCPRSGLYCPQCEVELCIHW